VACNRHGIVCRADAVQSLLAKYTRVASERCPSLASKRVSPHVMRHYVASRTMSRNFCLCPILRRKSPVDRDIVRPLHRARFGRDVHRPRFDRSCHGCGRNSGAATRVRLKGEAHMSGCALFSVTIKDSDRCRICSVTSGDRTEGSLEILRGPAITRGTCRFP